MGEVTTLLAGRLAAVLPSCVVVGALRLGNGVGLWALLATGLGGGTDGWVCVGGGLDERCGRGCCGTLRFGMVMPLRDVTEVERRVPFRLVAAKTQQ